MAITSLYNTVLRALKKERKAKNQNLESSSTLGRSSDGDGAARLGHSEMSESLSQEVTPINDQSPSKKRKKKTKRAKTQSKEKARELRSGSKLGRSSDGDDAGRLGHSEMSESLSQEVTPINDQSPSKKRKKKSTRAKKERKAKNQNLESSSTLGRSSDGDNVPKRGRSEVSEAPVQELAPVKEQNSSVQHHDENLAQPESLNTKSSPDKKNPEKDRKRLKIFKKIKKRFKRFGKKFSKKFEKKIINSLAGVALSVIVALIAGTTISNTPIEQQGQTQVINNMHCPASESASPVAIKPKQPDLRADSNSTQIYCVCCIVQQ